MLDPPMEVGLHDFCSDLHALKNLYLLLLDTTDNNPLCAMDEKTRLLLKKLLDNATQEVLQSKIVLPRSEQRDERIEHQMSVELQDCPPATERQNKVSGSIPGVQPEAPPQSEDAPVAESLISEKSCPICEVDQQQKNSGSIRNQQLENPSRRIPPSDHAAPERKLHVLRKGDNRSRVPSRRASPQASRRVPKHTLKRSRLETASPLSRTPSSRTCGSHLDRVVARKPDHRSNSSIASTGTAKNISRLKNDLPRRLRGVEPTARPEKPPAQKKLTRAAMVRGDRKTGRQNSCRVPSRSTRSGSCSSCRSGSGDPPVRQRRALSSRKVVNARTRKAELTPRGSPRRRSLAVVPSCHVKERRIPRRMLSQKNHITPSTKNREEVGEGRMKRLKNKLAVIFHHHHHHHIHNGGGVGEARGGESQHASLWGYVRRMLHHGGDGKTTAAAGRQEHHRYLHALLDALLRHVWGTRQRKAAAAKRRQLGEAARRLGKKKKKKLHWWQLLRRRGGVKLAGGKKGRRLRVGFGRTGTRTTKKSQ